MSALKALWKHTRKALDYAIDLEFNRRFERWPGSYRGVFQSFADAKASAGTNRKLGFDHPELSHLYDDRIGNAFPSDYPLLFWLGRLSSKFSSVFDWGGHVGVSYYTYSKYLGLAADVRWCVGDVPEIIKAGRALAAARSSPGLSFTTDFADADGCDVLLANGSLQFVEMPFADSLRRLQHPPKHVLVNKLPAYAGESFVTLENTIYSFNPYRVFNRDEFVTSITAQGYTLVDSWENPDVTLRLPLHRERSIAAYSGFYFRRASADTS
ncbi:MAG TPA: methyltransferase, TIGR04325 family [Polyangiaceae bacterium]|jgi:putative methyltransferase (TIGR04325 family)